MHCSLDRCPLAVSVQCTHAYDIKHKNFLQEWKCPLLSNVLVMYISAGLYNLANIKQIFEKQDI